MKEDKTNLYVKKIKYLGLLVVLIGLIQVIKYCSISRIKSLEQKFDLFVESWNFNLDPENTDILISKNNNLYESEISAMNIFKRRIESNTQYEE